MANNVKKFNHYMKIFLKNKIKEKLQNYNNLGNIKVIAEDEKITFIGNDLRNKSYGNFTKESKEKNIKDLNEEDIYEPLNLHQKFNKKEK